MATTTNEKDDIQEILDLLEKKGYKYRYIKEVPNSFNSVIEFVKK